MTAAHHRSAVRGRTSLDARSVGALLLSLVCLAGLSGATSRFAFTDQSNLKYALTVAAPLFGIALVLSRRPLLVVTCGVVMVAPFSFVATFSGAEFTPLTVVLGLGVVIAWSQQEVSALGTSPLSRAAVSFLTLMTLPFIAGTDRGRYALVVATGLAAGYVVAKTARSEAGKQTVLYSLVASAAVQGGLGLWEFATSHRLNLYGSAGGSGYATDYFFNFDNTFRPAAAFPDPIALGNFLAIACPFVIVAIHTTRTLRARVALALAGFVIVVGLAVTLSRLSWIGALAGTVVALVALGGRRAVISLIGVLATVAVAVALAIVIGGSAITLRFSSIADPTSTQVITAQGDITRLQLQHVALRVGEQHPFDGVGLNRLTPYLVTDVPGVSGATHAHNTYYQIFAEAGVLGLLGVGLLFVAALVCARRGWRDHRLVVGGSLGALVALAAVWATDYTIRNSSVMALVAAVFGLLAAVGARTARPT